MSVDPAARLAALNEPDYDEAIQLRFPPEECERLRALGLPGEAKKLIDQVSGDFVEQVEEAIVQSKNDISLSLEFAELLAFALKTRKRPSNRPKMSRDQQLRRDTLVAMGRRLKSDFRDEGLKAGAAKELAAKTIAQMGRQIGDPVSWQTFLKLIRSRPKK